MCISSETWVFNAPFWALSTVIWNKNSFLHPGAAFLSTALRMISALFFFHYLRPLLLL